MGGRRCTGSLHNPDEHHSERSSRTGLLICESSMGRPHKPVRTGGPHCPESCPNTITCKTLHRRGYRNLTESYCRVTTTTGDMRRSWDIHFRCAIRRHDYTIHAHTLLGSSNRNPRRDSRPEDYHFKTKHRMELETRTYLNQQRFQRCVPGEWEIDHEMQKL